MERSDERTRLTNKQQPRSSYLSLIWCDCEVQVTSSQVSTLCMWHSTRSLSIIYAPVFIWFFSFSIQSDFCLWCWTFSRWKWYTCRQTNGHLRSRSTDFYYRYLTWLWYNHNLYIYRWLCTTAAHIPVMIALFSVMWARALANRWGWSPKTKSA